MHDVHIHSTAVHLQSLETCTYTISHDTSRTTDSGREKLTLLSIPLTHTLTAAASTLDSSDDSIHVWRTAPFLVRKDIHAEFLLTSLDEADVGEHALVLERAGELGGDGGAGVDSGE
jgi:hypothetical protein